MGLKLEGGTLEFLHCDGITAVSDDYWLFKTKMLSFVLANRFSTFSVIVCYIDKIQN